MKKGILLLLGLLLTSNSFALTTTDKQIDIIQNSAGGSQLAVPSVGTTFDTDTNSVTLTNKTISGSSNTLTNIAASSLAAGTQVSVANGGTGAATLTLHNVIIGEGTSAVAFAAPTQFQALIGNSSGDPSFQALALNQATAVTGSLGAANGGTGVASLTAHDVLVGNGTSAITLISPTSNTGWVLTSNGTSSDPTFQVLPSMAPTINNSVASPQSVTAVGGVSLSAPSFVNVAFVKGGTPSSNVTVTAVPSITACTTAGQKLHVISESGTATFTLQNDADLAGSQLLLNGPWTSGENSSSPFTLDLICDGAATPNWVEVSRNN